MSIVYSNAIAGNKDNGFFDFRKKVCDLLMNTPPSQVPRPNKLRFNTWSNLRCNLYLAYSGPMTLIALEARRTWHGRFQTCYLLTRGHLKMSFEDEIDEVKSGEWFFGRTRPGQPKFSEDAELNAIHFSLCWPDGTPLIELESSKIAPASAHPELRRHTLALTALMKSLGNPRLQLRTSEKSLNNYFEVMSIFHQWCAAYARVMGETNVALKVPQETDSRIQIAMAWLQERDLSVPFRESDLAKRAGLSVSQLNRLFSRHYGITPLEFDERGKVEAAIRLLEQTGASVKSLAYQLGFSSPGNFSTWFHRKTQQTPTLWRRNAVGDL